MGTIIVALVLAAIVAAIIICGIRKRKNGRGGCSCGCSGCAMSEMCHKNNGGQ